MVFDIVIENGKILDGSGNPWFESRVCIEDGKIVAVRRKARGRGDVTIDATGKLVVPGFIDYHNHSDLTLLVNPRAESYISQGVTSIGIGNCGQSAAPISAEYRRTFEQFFAYHAYGINVPIEWSTYDEYLTTLEAHSPSVNVIPFVGHGTIRIAVMGFENRRPTHEELDRMKELVDKAFQAGVFSLSTGLDYVPNIYADTQEIIDLCTIVANYAGVYTTHTRGSQLVGIQEALRIGVATQVPVHILHYQYALPLSSEAFEAARVNGLDVTFDAYPYDGGCGSLDSQLQDFEGGWLFDADYPTFFDRIARPDIRERLKRDLKVDWTRLHLAVSKAPEDKQFEGMALQHVAAARGVDPVDAYCDLVLASNGVALLVYRHALKDPQIVGALQHPAMLVGSDGWALAPYGQLHVGTPHPRCYGTFPRILGHYVREHSVLGLPEAIRKMTSFPAQRLGLYDRGLIREGMWADVVVLDPETIGDPATYDDPHQYAHGIEYVIVNGHIVLEKGKRHDAPAGRVLRKTLFTHKELG